MMQKLELYIHIPFCVQKCAYCDFLSAPANDAAKAEYVDELKKEIKKKTTTKKRNTKIPRGCFILPGIFCFCGRRNSVHFVV